MHPLLPSEIVTFQRERNKSPGERARATANNALSILHQASKKCQQTYFLGGDGSSLILTWHGSSIQEHKDHFVAEFTILWEDRLAISHQLMIIKYQDIINEILIKG